MVLDVQIILLILLCSGLNDSINLEHKCTFTAQSFRMDRQMQMV